ncbi:terminase small subunit [Fructobacillus evanidus]|uniref:Contains N-terminal HTH domain (YjcR) n=1 Tax=Fructobacillus evanidus TaxID=3064281 RepID=A0ABN9YJI9_9LACO|nr:Uncharacterized conserved protein YjcR [Fructobacillus sp. LMG 32999]CAK1222209.1 Uncharacterized conserved protein YjcR [Fructobacillus sp. LMG 32999]CAK1225827.1 Uncharacterized conserved protein YjcR [Fructobacillus sp. LMG 32999]CAK1226044.1 Uncharacterized conserved protein YjcR [Fructobacillus sp. LMG 32999]CAK1226188.1 Uncharacterized conserved protein YjcR [Fructobacillus sp. LMG 32999]
MTKRDEAKQDYLAGMKPKDIANKYEVSAATVRSWKARYWSIESPPKNVATKSKSVATKNENVATHQELHPAIQELDDSELNDRQKHFVMEYVRLSNATQAYINAYNVDYDSAKVAAHNLLTNINIQTEIKRLHTARMAEQSVGVFDLVDDLIVEAKADVRDFAEWGSNEFEAIDEESGKQYTRHKSWVALKDSNSVDSKAIKKITVGKDGPIVELHDRNKARDRLLEKLLGKGVFADGDGEQKININMDSFEEKDDGDN